jgi:V/A-type H+/Na+-transporting ATPase subunit D
MERLRISATKSNLLRTKEELRFAREGKNLLTQKREVLVLELLRLQEGAHLAREELNRQLAEAFRAFTAATLLEGFDAMERRALTAPPEPQLQIEERSVMGVAVPTVEGTTPAWRPTSLAGGSAEGDRAVRLLLAAQEKIREVAEIETAIYRLSMETRKTLRRERALENLFIPQYAATVKFIEESLDEKDREGFYHLKLIKRRKVRSEE